jgi:glycosyltransferase involved in cell wall biosynthesis
MSRSIPTVVIVRDRASSGGGIYNYYKSVTPHLKGRIVLCDSGKPYVFYGDHKGAGTWLLEFTPVRLMIDWLRLALNILRYWPDVVLLNPCLDPPTYKSLRRDAVNILIARFFRRRVLSFWRGWENAYSGQPEFPGGNQSRLCRIYQMADEHLVLSERFRQDLLRWNFKTPVHVETTVVEDQCLNGAPNPPAPGKARTNLLYLSRVEVAKGVWELLDAFKILKSRNPAYTLTIGGDGPDLEALKAYAKELNLSDVNFTGFLKGQAKVDCYRQGSVFCFLSYTEGMPNAVLEALAMGLPVVSSDAGGLRDILRDRENGFIVLPNYDGPLKKKVDPQAVADAIEKLVNTPELHERISTINWRYARQRFAAPVVAKRLEAFCQNVANGKKALSKAERGIPVYPK